MNIKRITIPYSIKIDLIKKLDAGEIKYEHLAFQGHKITYQQVQRWKEAIEAGRAKKPNLPSNRPTLDIPKMADLKKVREKSELIDLKVTLCDAFLEIMKLEKMLSQKFVERRGTVHSGSVETLQ